MMMNQSVKYHKCLEIRHSPFPILWIVSKCPMYVFLAHCLLFLVLGLQNHDASKMAYPNAKLEQTFSLLGNPKSTSPFGEEAESYRSHQPCMAYRQLMAWTIWQKSYWYNGFCLYGIFTNPKTGSARVVARIPKRFLHWARWTANIQGHCRHRWKYVVQPICIPTASAEIPS